MTARVRFFWGLFIKGIEQKMPILKIRKMANIDGCSTCSWLGGINPNINAKMQESPPTKERIQSPVFPKGTV